MNEFDSEFCSVRYMEADNAVLLTWRKFARLDDYRKPTLFALDLLKKHPKSNFVVDARNGFEDDPADVEWGFSELLPAMGKTDCKYVVFIMDKVPVIEDEIDMWTKEFGKYFAVAKAESYDSAIRHIKERILVNVRYTMRPGKRNEFLEKVIAQDIIRDSKAEPGNYCYQYSVPIDAENELHLLEQWVNSNAQSAHGNTEHYRKLQALKKEYVTSVEIEKFKINQL